jgi:hypothetical protein
LTLVDKCGTALQRRVSCFAAAFGGTAKIFFFLRAKTPHHISLTKPDTGWFRASNFKLMHYRNLGDFKLRHYRHSMRGGDLRAMRD